MCSYDKLYPYLFLFLHITSKVFHIALSPLILEWISQVANTGVKGARNHWSKFVGADGRRPFGRLGVVGDNRRPFGTKSLSREAHQLCVCRHRISSREPDTVDLGDPLPILSGLHHDYRKAG